MKVFIGWSGERSQRVAEALLGWLQRLFFPLHLVRASGPCEAKRLRGRHEEELKRRVIDIRPWPQANKRQDSGIRLLFVPIAAFSA
jgi:hypothetical protein